MMEDSQQNNATTNGYRQGNPGNQDAIERMRSRPPSWINVTLIGINVIVFLLVELTGSSEDTEHMIAWGAAYTPLITEGKQYWRIFTSMFLHFGISHILNNMILLFFLGDTLERVMGRIRYLLVYLLGGIGAGTISYISHVNVQDETVSAGASGAIFAVIGAMIYVLIANKGRVEDLTTGRMMLMAALTLAMGFTTPNVDNAAHLGGLLCGFLIAVLIYRRKDKPFTQERQV